MPLRRATVTAASRIMLPTYPLFFAVVGLSLTLTGDRLLATPGFRFADSLLPLEVFGVGYLLGALVLTLALLVDRASSRRTYQHALAAAMVWMLGWTGLMVAAAVEDLASFSAWVWPAFVARACWASYVSLELGERS